MPCIETAALVAEMGTPKHCDKVRTKDARKGFSSVLHDRIRQANEYLALHADMVEEETSAEVKAMSEELRQTFIAMRDHATDLDARIHRFREIDEQVDRLVERLKNKVEQA